MAIFDTGAGGKQNLKFITASAEQILEGYVGADAKGKPVEGAMQNNGAVDIDVNAGESYIIPQGYHSGEGKVNAVSTAATYHASYSSFDADETSSPYKWKFTFPLPDFVPDAVFVVVQIYYGAITGTLYSKAYQQVIHVDYKLKQATEGFLTGYSGTGKFVSYGKGKTSTSTSVDDAKSFSAFPYNFKNPNGTVEVSVTGQTTNTFTAMFGEIYAVKY